MWWENGSWLRVQSVLGAALGALYSVTDLATRYIFLLGLVRVIHTYSTPFLVMNIYMIFGNTSRTLLEHKWGGLLPLLLMKTWLMSTAGASERAPDLTSMKMKILIFTTKCLLKAHNGGINEGQL